VIWSASLKQLNLPESLKRFNLHKRLFNVGENYMLDLKLNRSQRSWWQFAAVLSLLLFVSITTSQAQTTTFGQFVQRDTAAQNFVFTNNGNSASFGTVNNGNPVSFLYGGIANLPAELQGFQNATIFVTSTTTSPAVMGAEGNLVQPISNTFTIEVRRDTPAANGGGTRRNLLTAVVTQGAAPANITGQANSASYTASTPSSTNQTVTYTSDFLDLTQTTDRNFGISFSSVTPALSFTPGGFFNSFTASGSGTFASNPPPRYDPPTAAAVNISGRILTADGRGVSRAQVNLTEANGTTRIAVSNSFGYYHFNEVEGGQTVVVSVFAKRYTFATQVVSTSNELTNLDFTAQQ
jgi:hypothetical protein